MHLDQLLTCPIAHRGLHDRSQGRPENSIEAIEAAIAAGYAIEIDLQLSKDNIAMVFHDHALERLTKSQGLVHDHTRAQLMGIGLTDARSTIPSLSLVLDLVKGQVPLLIELKDQDGHMGDNTGALEAATAVALEGYQGEVAVMSFNPHSVFELSRCAPKIPRGLVTSSYKPEDWPELTAKRCEELREIGNYDRVKASFISHDAKDLTRPRVRELKQKGAHILCWTTTSFEQDKKARLYADNVTFEGYLP